MLVIDCCMGRDFYVGGTTIGKYDLDHDTFGYFDIKGLVEEIGYLSWSNLLYRIPKFDSYKILKADKEVMKMLPFLSHNCRVLHMYVDGGIRQQMRAMEEYTEGDDGKEVLNEEGGNSSDEELGGRNNGDAHDQDEDEDWGSEEDDSDYSDYEPSNDESSYENLDDLVTSDEDDVYLNIRGYIIFLI